MNWSSFGTFEGWLAIIGLAIGTFAIRYSFIGLLAGKKLPPRFERALHERHPCRHVVGRALGHRPEATIQAAFKETADALAGGATWRAQREALQAQRSAARETARLTSLRAEQGAASTLELLEAQRSLFAAEQAVLQARQGELNNRVALFKALGG